MRYRYTISHTIFALPIVIKHRTKRWVVDGNRQIIDGQLDESEVAMRGANEPLEDELMRLYPDQWDPVNNASLIDFLDIPSRLENAEKNEN